MIMISLKRENYNYVIEFKNYTPSITLHVIKKKLFLNAKLTENKTKINSLLF